LPNLKLRGVTHSFTSLTNRDTFRSVHRGKHNVPIVNPVLDYAFAFDIDGVLMLGSNAIPAGTKALKLLNEKKIPYILLTNGGGKWEHDRVAELSDRLGVNVKSTLRVRN